MTKPRKYPGPWRRVSRELKDEYTLSLVRGQLHIRTTYYSLYRKTVDRHGNYDERRETESGPDLGWVMEKLKISDKESNIIMLMEGALDLIHRLVKRHDFYLWRAERAEKARRKKEWEKKKRVWDARKTHNTRMQRVSSKQFGRTVEV